MESSHWEQVQAIFHSVVDLPEAERTVALKTACGDDGALKADVMALLEEDALGTPFFNRNLSDLARQAVDPGFTEGLFDELGPYRIIQFLGEGGMGVVYLAERKDLGSLVAIKLLRDAWLSPARRGRFASEQRTLAQLNHPGIARIYDAGILKDGTPWFVMEYVKGAPLTEHCRSHIYSVRERLRLFRVVCEAVQYAHGQAIIHRDLKPSNILIHEDGTAKLLDFGIAKHLEEIDEPATKANETQTFLRLMTPGYASPEQIRGERIGTYTDVYSLGVILYELLTGSLPFDFSRLTPGEADNLVVRTAPLKPSSAARQSGQQRSFDDDDIGLAGWKDLDVLCLTAMHRDVARRYQSAEALIRDIDHYLREEPLEARPDSLRYKSGKFVRRNRRGILTASLIFASMVALVVFFMVRLSKARRAAEAETARTQRVERFMLNLFEGGDIEAAPSSQLLVTTLLDRGARQVAELDSDPQTQVDLDETLGRMYQELGDYKKAEPLLLQALEKAKSGPTPDPSRVTSALTQLGLLQGDQAQYQDAEKLVQQAAELARGHLSENDSALLDAEATLGLLLTQSGSPEKAIPILERVIHAKPSGEDGSFILRNALSTLGVAEYYAGHHEDAQSIDLRAIAMDRQLLGESHPKTGTDLMNLGTAEVSLGQDSAAETHYREGIAINEAWYGPDHPDSATMRVILASLLIKEGKEADAETILKKALEIQEKIYGKVHDRIALTLDMLGRIALKRNNPDAGRAYFSRALEIDRTLLGDNNFRTAIMKIDLGDAYLREAKYAEAEPFFQQAVKIVVASLPASDPHVSSAQASWGRVLLRLKRYREAETQLSASYQNLKMQPHPPDAALEEVRKDLAEVYIALGRPDQAEQLLSSSPHVASIAASNSGGR